jgi:hypothetical protein
MTVELLTDRPKKVRDVNPIANANDVNGRTLWE